MRAFGPASGRRLACIVRPRMTTTKRSQLAFATLAVIGVFAARAYYRWLLHSGMHKTALHSYGLVGYWSWLALPAIVVFVPLCFVALRYRAHVAGWAVAGAALAAIIVAYLGLFGDFLFCALITRGVCE